jgi:2OG-Fe(II) oxygenase superfamily
MIRYYAATHFLTAHDDRDESKGRVAAYVLNLTPRWSSDWDGLLQFLDADGHVAEAYTPAFNALNVFRVPQPHSVSFVAPFAGQPRLSITGWFRRRRAGPPPAVAGGGGLAIDYSPTVQPASRPAPGIRACASARRCPGRDRETRDRRRRDRSYCRATAAT